MKNKRFINILPSCAKRCAAMVLALLMCISAVGCGKDNTLEEREQLVESLYGSVQLTDDEATLANLATTSNFTIAYCKPNAADPATTLNPFTCESTLNAAISDLIYDQLVVVNSSYEIENVIARDIEFTSSMVLSVNLRDGIVFSDGSELTGEDVKYSFEAAKADGSRFAAQLVHFVNCMYTENSISFRLDEADPLAYMLLDFPIIKKDSDTGTNLPIGSGRYYYYNDSETGTYLLRNPKWYNNSGDYQIKRISLVSMPTIESIVHSVEIGTVSYFYTDLRDGYPNRLNAYYSPVNLNNLIYLGMDTSDTRIRDFQVRKAISDALNREEIITNAYAGRAYAATGPLTTAWAPAATAQSGSTLNNTELAVQELNDAGFMSLDESYVRHDANGHELSLFLMVNHDNPQLCAAADIIVKQLAAVGINLIKEEVSFNTFKERIAAAEYDLYLAEYSLLNNMDFSPLFTPNNGIYYGLEPAMTIGAWDSYCDGTATIADVIDAFESEYPFIPVCYRLGLVCYSRSIDAHMDVTESDFFYDLDLWDIALAKVEEEKK